MITVLAVLLASLFFFSSNSFSQNIVQLKDQQQVYPLGQAMQIFEDPSHEMTFEDIVIADFQHLFISGDRAVPAFGLTNSSFWVKFTVKNTTAKTGEWILGQFNANTHYIDLYSTNGQNNHFSVKQSGNLRPFSYRDIPHRLVLFKINLEPQQQRTYYLNIKSGSAMTLDLRIMSWPGLIQYNQFDNHWHGFVFGILFIMMIYNLFLYYSLNDHSYIWLITFIASVLCFASFYEGFAQTILPDWIIKYSYLGASLSGNMIAISLIKFNHRFLASSPPNATISFIENTLLSLFILLTVLTPFISYGSWIKLVIPPILIMIGFIVFLITYNILKRNLSYRLFSSGWYVMLATLAIFLLTRLSWIPSNFITENIFALGVSWMVLFMSLAQADKFNQLRRKAQLALQALQESEQELLVSNTKYQSLFESANDAIFLIKDDVFVECNLKTLELFDCELDEIIGKSPVEFSPELQTNGIPSQQLAEEKTEIALSGKAQFFEWKFVTQKGDPFDAEVSLKRIRLGDAIYLLALVRSITEKKLIEEQLNRSQKMDAMGKLTGGIAHDYNNMLGVIIGFADILDAQLADKPKLREYAQRILQAGKRSQKLTSKLLAFSRHKDSENQQVNINNILQDNQHILAKTLTAKIQLELDLSKQLWPVWLDKNDFEDALFNIAINAMHAMPDGGKLIMRSENIFLSQQQASPLGLISKHYVHLSISDTGIGMNQDTLDRVFDPFFTTKGDEGTGLGMSQVYGFITRSESGIHIDSEPGKGTTLHLYIPRYMGKAQPQEVEQESSDEKSSGNETIMVVDDEPALCYLSEEILISQGYRVIIAESGEQALEQLARFKVDLIISDVIMPGMNGFQLATEVRKKYPDIKFQLASGYSDTSFMSSAQDQHLIDNMLHKPFDKESLMDKVRRHLNH